MSIFINGQLLQPGPSIYQQAYGSTITFDLNNGRVQQVQLAGNPTLALANEPATGAFTLVLQQPDSGGANTVTWWSGINWAGGSAPTLTTTNGYYDIFSFVKLGSGNYLGMAVQNFA